MDVEKVVNLEPEIIQRVRGGVMAITRRNAGIRIGVICDTEVEARLKFAELVDGWLKARDKERDEAC